jgi:hypothetical protein
MSGGNCSLVVVAGRSTILAFLFGLVDLVYFMGVNGGNLGVMSHMCADTTAIHQTGREVSLVPERNGKFN